MTTDFTSCWIRLVDECPDLGDPRAVFVMTSEAIRMIRLAGFEEGLAHRAATLQQLAAMAAGEPMVPMPSRPPELAADFEAIFGRQLPETR